MSNRKGEKNGTHFRSDRIEHINGQWFFRMREQAELVGPFSTRERAQKAAKAYMEDTASGKSAVNTMSNQYLAKAFSLR